VRVDLSEALTSALQELLGDNFDNLIVDVVTSAVSDIEGDYSSYVGYVIADVSFFIEDMEQASLLDAELPLILAEPDAYFTIFVDLSDIDIEGVNHHRITALHEGRPIGGRVDTETGYFTITASSTGEFAIAYVEKLIRLDMNLNSPVITDLAGNAPTQVMDVLPFIQDGRTLIPIRFISDALGAEIDWTNATDDRPLTVYLTLNGQTLSFGIGEITPQLAELGMDVPAQLMGNRTMVPLRFVSEFFGAVVNWDSDTRSIEIISLGTSPNPNTNTNHNPLTGGTPIMALAREDEDEGNEQV